MMYSKYNKEESLAVLEKIYEWKHLFPTAPDTLRCYPIKNSDPLILKEHPQLLAVGSQNSFQYERYSNIGLLAVPKLKSGAVALLDAELSLIHI